MLKTPVCKLALLILLLFTPIQATANFMFNDTPLKQAIATIEQETGYFFLFRESQVADITITLESSEEAIFSNIRRLLLAQNLSVTVDHSRKQVLITRLESRETERAEVVLSGQIVDAATGERLPYATLTWSIDGEVSGAVTNSSGSFNVTRSEEHTSELQSL